MDQSIFSEYYPYLLLLAGLVILAIAMFWESQNSKLKQTGICVEGIVFEQDVESSFRLSFSEPDHYRSIKDKVTIRFVTKKQEWITAPIKQDFSVFYTGQYKDGDKVVVYYEEKNPSNFYVDSKQSETIVRIIAALLGLMLTIAGLYLL